MKRMFRQVTGLTAAGGMLLQFAGCTPELTEQVAVLFRDFAREALAALLF